MVGMLLVSHGKMAEGMMDTLGMVMGKQERLDHVSLVMGEDYDVFESEICDKIRELNDGDGVLVLVDLFGASPFNVSQKAAHALEAEGIKVGILSGMNLGMVVEALAMRQGTSLDDVLAIAMNAGRTGIDVPARPETAQDDGDDY